jgi:hypothetical protein
MAGHGGHAVIFRSTSDFPNLKNVPAQKLKIMLFLINENLQVVSIAFKAAQRSSQANGG